VAAWRKLAKSQCIAGWRYNGWQSAWAKKYSRRIEEGAEKHLKSGENKKRIAARISATKRRK
jgi:hypothetical protein